MEELQRTQMEEGKAQGELILQEFKNTEPNGQEWESKEPDEQKEVRLVENEEHPNNANCHKTENQQEPCPD